MPVMRAMPLAFPGNALTRGYETQFMCGDALLVAPIVARGRRSRRRAAAGRLVRPQHARSASPGAQVLRYRATLDQFPVFGREGHALPLGRAVQHTGEIDARNPLEQLWVFGKPAARARRLRAGAHRGRRRRRASRCDVARASRSTVFGDAAGVRVDALERAR